MAAVWPDPTTRVRENILPLLTLLEYFLRAYGEFMPLGSLGEEPTLDAAALEKIGRTLRRPARRADALNG